ncbi:MAG TPA: 16S rRNA (cytidine(1402)-2'-O)-methyltransferase [Vicinamibacterales bacterium]|nr:16S rRNA (cytidine(1402)-2'-O)-methyltransferase [Vicinamibacterales bacterium]
MAGTLFVVATPIGNLEDLTFRALRTLREVDVIAAEDTRRTAKLLAHYEIRKPLVSLREHNETREAPRLIARLQKGESIALVSDAGTPSIADPGARLVRAVREAQLSVIPIPGATAVATLLSASGFSGDQFVFLGFPPSSGAARDRWFHQLATETRVALFFEAPHRAKRTLGDLLELVKRPIIVGRELTKANEELVDIHNISDVGKLRLIGEFVIIVAGETNDLHEVIDSKAVVAMFGQLTEFGRLDSDVAIKLTSLHFNIPAVTVKNLAKKARFAARRDAGPLP